MDGWTGGRTAEVVSATQGAADGRRSVGGGRRGDGGPGEPGSRALIGIGSGLASAGAVSSVAPETRPRQEASEPLPVCGGPSPAREQSWDGKTALVRFLCVCGIRRTAPSRQAI